MYRRYIRTNLQIALEEGCKYCLLNTFSIVERYCNFCVFCMLHGDSTSILSILFAMLVALLRSVCLL